MTQSISDDMRVIEAALAANPALTEYPWHWHADPIKGDPLAHSRYEVVEQGRTITRTYYSDAVAMTEAAYIAAAHPARLRRVLDTMRLMGEALEACLPSIDPYSRERAEADAALAAYRGETK